MHTRLPLIVAVSSLAAVASNVWAAEGDYTRSLAVERLAPLTHLMTCRTEYRDLNRDHTYTVRLQTLWFGGENGFPEGYGTVSRGNPKATLSGPTWTFTMTMRGDRIDAVMERQLDGPINSTSIHCTSSGVNNTTGLQLPAATQADQPGLE